MKKYIVLIVILFFGFFLSGCSQEKSSLNDLEAIRERGYLIVGVKSDSPPFGFYKGKSLAGIDVDIAYFIADCIFKNESPANVKFVNVTAQNRISKLNSKEVDILVATMSVNDKRKLVIDFSIPYFVASQKLVVKKTSSITHLHYFNKNGRLAVVMGTTGEKISRLIAPNANIIGTKTYTEAYNLLKKSKVDGILGDDCILQVLIDENYKMINRAYSREYYAVALRKSDKSKELLNEVNAAVATILDEKSLVLLQKESFCD